MKGTNLTYGQMIAIGVAILFGVPICLGIVAGYFLGFWLGVIVGGLALLLIAYLAQRWLKRTDEQGKEDRQ
jgi:Na+/H+ antiporter NhaC